MTVADKTLHFSLSDQTESNASSGTYTFPVEETINVPDGEIWYVESAIAYGTGRSSGVDSGGINGTRRHEVRLAAAGGTNIDYNFHSTVFVDVNTQDDHNSTDTRQETADYYVHGNEIDQIEVYQAMDLDYGGGSGDTFSENVEVIINIRQVL